jgi:hypothetical protein
MGKENTEATEEKKEKTGATKKEDVKRLSPEEMTELNPRELAAYNKSLRDECGDKINELLQEYGMDLSAKMIIEPGNITPQVMLIHARPQGNIPG